MVGRFIRPVFRRGTHNITQIENFRDEGHLRTDYFDVEDFSIMHITFEDGSIADIFASEIVMGGIHNWLQVVANNHRTTCNINPNTAMETYNPVDANFKDIYTVEKIGTKQGGRIRRPMKIFLRVTRRRLKRSIRLLLTACRSRATAGWPLIQSRRFTALMSRLSKTVLRLKSKRIRIFFGVS